MTTELLPRGILCNLGCTYCYQTPMRDAGNMGNEAPYDMEKMFAALEKAGSDFLVFGGEPLLVPIYDLQKIFAWGFERYKKNGIQTNGVLITPEHLAMFKRYNVHVGFSLDGPGELNDSRWNGTLERTRESTEKSHANLKACVEQGINTSLIITLYKGNASADALPRLKSWIVELDRMGVRGARIHLLEVDHPLVRERMQLPIMDTIQALRELVELDASLSKDVNLAECATRAEAESRLAELGGQHRRLLIWERQGGDAATRFVVWEQGFDLDFLKDMRALLRAQDDNISCIWNPCDPYTTEAVQGIDGQGNRSNCGRTNKDGIPRVKADTTSYVRQVGLYHTPLEYGGCQGCRFFLMCKGQCPGTAIDGDWRNRSEQCPIWFALFEQLEQQMVAAGEVPLSLAPDRVLLEHAMVRLWDQGGRSSLREARKHVAEHATIPENNGHSDVPHGDEHGDHWDGPDESVPH